MPRIIWHRRGVEWVGRLTAAGPDRFAVRKVTRPGAVMWSLSDFQAERTGLYAQLRQAKSAAETMR